MNEHAAPRRVFRSRSDRVLAGVAGGFARYLGLDVSVVRLVLVLLAFVGGIGVLVYLAAWLVVPEEPVGVGADASGPPSAHTRAGWGWTVVLVVVAIALLAELGRIGFGVRPGVVWPLALIGFGVAVLWLRAGDRPAAGGTVAGTASAGAAAPGWGPTTAPEPAAAAPGTLVPAPPSGSSAGPDPSALDPDAPSTPWRVAPVTPSPLRRAAPVLGRMALAIAAAFVALVVAVGIVLLLEGPGAVKITAAEAVVAAVLVALVAVAVGLGRHRLPDLVVVALPVFLVLALAAWIGPPLRGGFGTRDLRPADVGGLDHTYRLAGGTLVLDLGAVDLGGRTRSVTASVALGRLRVVVPDQVTVVVDAHVDAGEARVLGLRDAGTGVSRHAIDRAGTGTLRLKLAVGFGQIIVERASDSTARVGATTARAVTGVAA